LFCLSERTWRMVVSLMEQFHWTTRYYSLSGATLDTDLIDDWAAQAERELGMWDGCNQNPIGYGNQVRININGTIEVSTDGGSSWNSAPGYDPRLTGEQAPPLQGADGSTKKCQSANNAEDKIRQIWTIANNYLDAGQALLDITDALLTAFEVYLGAVGAVAFIIQQVAVIAFNAGADAFTSAFDEDVWARLQCNLYCHVGADGRFDGTAIAAILDQLDTDETGIANLWLKNCITTLGQVGLSNAGAIGTSAGDDCGDCSCGCVVSQNYYAIGEDWTGGLEANNGSNVGRYLDDTNGNSATFTIPDRAGRLIAGVWAVWSGAALVGSGSPSLTVTAGGIDSDESPKAWGGTAQHTFSTPVDDDVITITTNGSLNIHLTYVTVDYEC